ncbi:MAG: phosphodiester glycosidase family protein [Armatimonadota bacterium]|nr:phosphodiester glycosidase family protein [Armatimonadota bacterium]
MSENIVRGTFVLFIVLLALLVQVSLAQASDAPAAFGATFIKHRVLGIRVHMVVVDLNDPSYEVGVALSRGGLRTSESFVSMVNRTRPVAAITGTFFCTRSLIPVGDIVIDGRRVHRGPIGASLAFTFDNRVAIHAAGKGARIDWTGCAAGLRSGPQLISGGLIRIDARREGFRDRGLFGRRLRSAIGVTSKNKLLLVAVRTPVTFSELAKVMRRLGAVEAVNLDGGSSTALSYGGKIKVWPGRRLTNVIVVTKRKPFVPRNAPVPIAAPLPAPRPDGISASPPASVPTKPPVVAQAPEQHAALPEKPFSMERLLNR